MKSTRRLVAASLAIGAFALAPLAGCEEKGPMEEAGEKMDDAADEAGDAIEEAGDKLEDLTDGG